MTKVYKNCQWAAKGRAGRGNKFRGPLNLFKNPMSGFCAAGCLYNKYGYIINTVIKILTQSAFRPRGMVCRRRFAGIAAICPQTRLAVSMHPKAVGKCKLQTYGLTIYVKF